MFFNCNVQSQNFIYFKNTIVKHQLLYNYFEILNKIGINVQNLIDKYQLKIIKKNSINTNSEKMVMRLFGSKKEEKN